MSENKTTPITPTEEEYASWDTQMDDSSEVIKRIKRNNKFRCQSPEPDSSYPIELPQPMFREVPVHVSRTPNRSVQAMPPPSAQPQALPSRRKNQGRRRPKRLGGNGDGDGSESDSGGDGQRNGRHSPDGPLQKRKPPPPEVEPPCRDLRSLKGKQVAQKAIVLSPEEKRRVLKLKRLHAFEKAFGDRLDLRSLNKAESKDKRKAFLQGKTIIPFYPVVLDDVEQKQAALNEYLDDSLYFAIVDNRLSSETDHTEKLPAIASLIAEAESRVIKLICSLRNKAKVVAREMQGLDHERIVSILPPPAKSYLPSEIRIPRFPTSYWAIENLSIRRPQLDELRDDKDPLVKTYLDLIMDGTPDGNFGGVSITNILVYSGRSQGKENLPSPEYIESLRSRVGAATFDDLVSRRARRSAKNPLEEYKKRMEDVHMDVSQEFFQFGNEVDLVLFKGGRPSTIQRVLPDDLQRMGWRLDGDFGRDQQGAERRYWRYATFDDHPGEVFAVDMEGDILGIVDRVG